MNDGLSHLDDVGAARMVDVSSKDVTLRRAVATATLVMATTTLDAIERGALQKGDVLAVARVAAIGGAKQTSLLIPLCHNIVLDKVTVDFSLSRSDGERSRVTVTAEAVARGRTGVEMEALTACSVAALTLYDMCKAVDRAMVIEHVRLERKEGGRTGVWQRTSDQ